MCLCNAMFHLNMDAVNSLPPCAPGRSAIQTHSMAFGREKISELISRLSKDDSRETISIGEFLSALGDRSFGLAILIFALPNALPVPGIPGVSTILGLPIIFFGLQMLAGKEKLWLPSWLSRKSFSRRSFNKILAASVPYVQKMEKFLKPRLPRYTGKGAERLAGLIIVALAGILAIPLPAGNFLPGLGITILAFGLLEEDGAVILSGLIFGVIAFTLMILYIFVLEKVITEMLHHLYNSIF